MSELLDQINTDTNKETISVKELTKALETGFFDKQENISTMIEELNTIDNTLERSCVQSLLKVAYQSPLYDKLQQYPEFINRLQIWSQHSYLEHMNVDEKQIGQISLLILPKKSEDVTLTTLSKYVDLKNILPEHHDMVLSVLQNQVKLFTQLCPDGKSSLDMKWNSKKNGLDASILKFSTISSLSDRIKKEAQVRKDYETIKNHNLKQIDPGKISKDCLKLWTITKLSTLPTELAKLDTQSAFAQYLQKNQNDVFYGPILQQYIGIRLQPYLRKEGPVEYISATIDKENPELKNYVVGTVYGKQLIQQTSEGYKDYKKQQEDIANIYFTGASTEQFKALNSAYQSFQNNITPDKLKNIQKAEDQRNHERIARHSQSTKDTMPYIEKGSVDKYRYNQTLLFAEQYVKILLETPQGKKFIKEKAIVPFPFPGLKGVTLNFGKGILNPKDKNQNAKNIVRDSFTEKWGDSWDEFTKAYKEGKREEVGRTLGSLIGGTVAAGATTILTGGSGIWVAGAAFTIGSRTGGALGGAVGRIAEDGTRDDILKMGLIGLNPMTGIMPGMSVSEETKNAFLVGLGVGERDQNGKFVNYFTDTDGAYSGGSVGRGTRKFMLSAGTDYLSSVATFGLGNKIGLDKWAGKFVGTGRKQFASKGAVFGAEELFIENFLVDIPANTFLAGASSFTLGNVIQKTGQTALNNKKDANLNHKEKNNTEEDPQRNFKAALGAMKQTFAQNISPENLRQTFIATIAYGGMLEGGRGAINRVSVALPALSVKNINEISIAYQSHLSDLQTKFPTLSIGKDMSTLTLDGKLLDQTHPRFAELQGSLTALQTLGASFTQEMEKISQIQQQLTDPTSPEAKKRGLIYGRKLLHPRMTPLEVLDSRIKKLQSEIASTKKADIKAQKEAVMKQMEDVRKNLGAENKNDPDAVSSESEVQGKIESDNGQTELEKNKEKENSGIKELSIEEYNQKYKKLIDYIMEKNFINKGNDFEGLFEGLQFSIEKNINKGTSGTAFYRVYINDGKQKIILGLRQGNTKGQVFENNFSPKLYENNNGFGVVEVVKGVEGSDLLTLVENNPTIAKEYAQAVGELLIEIEKKGYWLNDIGFKDGHNVMYDPETKIIKLIEPLNITNRRNNLFSHESSLIDQLLQNEFGTGGGMDISISAKGTFLFYLLKTLVDKKGYDIISNMDQPNKKAYKGTLEFQINDMMGFEYLPIQRDIEGEYVVLKGQTNKIDERVIEAIKNNDINEFKKIYENNKIVLTGNTTNTIEVHHNDYFGKPNPRIAKDIDSKQARDHSAYMDKVAAWFKKGPSNLAEGLGDVRNKIQKLYTDKTGKPLELTDAQIQTIIATHLKPGELGKLTQAELKAKVAELATAIPDADVRRFLLEAGFCGTIGDTQHELQQNLIGELSSGFIGDIIDRNIRDDLSTWIFNHLGIQSFEELKKLVYNYDPNNIKLFDPDVDNLLRIKELAPKLDMASFLKLRDQVSNGKLFDIANYIESGGLHTESARVELIVSVRDRLYNMYSDIKHLDPTQITPAMKAFFDMQHSDTYQKFEQLINVIKAELGSDGKSWHSILDERIEHVTKLSRELNELHTTDGILYNKFFQNTENQKVFDKYKNSTFLYDLAKYGMGHINNAPDISKLTIPDTDVIKFINSGKLDGLDKNLATLLSNTFTSKNKNTEYCTHSIPTFMESIRDGSGIRFIDKEGDIFYTKFDAEIKTSLKINTKNNEVDFGGVSDLDFMIGKFVYKNKGLLSVEDINKELQKRGLEYQVLDNKGSLEIHSNHQIKFESVNGQTNTNIFIEDGNPGSYWGAIYGNVTETELFKVYGDVILELNAMREKDISVENLIQFYEKGKILATQLKHSEYIIAIDKILDDLHNKSTNRYMQIMDLIISNIEKPPGNILQEIQKIYNLP